MEEEVGFVHSKNRKDSLEASQNDAKVYFPTDSNAIIHKEKEYGTIIVKLTLSEYYEKKGKGEIEDGVLYLITNIDCDFEATEIQ